MVFDFRLRAFEPNGDVLGILPEPLSVTASFVNNDDGALQVEYSTLAAGGPILSRGLEQGLEVAVEVASGTGWVEPVNARFLLLGRDLDSADAAGKLSLTLPSFGWLLRKARNLETANLLPEDHNQAGKRAFLSANAGVILGTLLLENAGRSGIVLGRGFTSARDSANAAWSKIATLYYDLGLDLWTVLNNLALQGMADWRTQGRELLLYNPDTVCAPDVADSVFLRLGRDVGEAPSSESLEEVVGRVLIRGEDGLTISEDNPSAPSPWGTWEGFISQGGVADEGTARSLVQADLERGARVRGQYTRQLVGLERARHAPMVDYVPGSWITAPTTGTGERVRVQQITLTKDANGVSGSVVLNDRVLDAELRRSRRVTGIVGGSMRDGGSGVRPSPEGPDRRTPAKPEGLVVATNAYIDKDGNPRGLIFAEWGAVSTATDGTLLEVASYDFAVRENVPGAPWKTVRSTDDTTVDYSPLPVGSEQLVRVRARGRYATTPGRWSDIVGVLVAEDTTPPPVPSLPLLSTKLGVVTVKWDGETDVGTEMPLDFDVVRVYQQGVEEPIGTLRETGGSDFLVVTGLVWGEPARFRFTSVDTSENESEPTSWVSITPVGVVDEDLVETTIRETIEDIEGQVDYAVESADRKSTNYFGPNEPDEPEGGFAVGDTWFAELDDGVLIHHWDGDAWVQERVSIYSTSRVVTDAIRDAKSQADFAVQAANGKNTIYRGPNSPTPPSDGFKEGDTWFDTSTGDTTIKTWDGAGWVVQELGPTGIAPDAITETHITDDSISTPKLQANAVEADNLAANAVTAGKIATGSIVAGDGVIASLDAGTISTGVLDSDRIGAQTVTADKLVIGGASNLVPGPGGYEHLYTVGSNNSIASSGDDPSGAQFRVGADGTTNGAGRIIGPPVPVKGGDRIHLRAYVGRTGDPDAPIRVYCMFNETINSTWIRFVPDVDSSGYIEGTVTVPDEMLDTGDPVTVAQFALSALGGTQGNYWIRYVECYKQVSGTLIEDGAITTGKIAADAVTANEIATGSITASSGIIASLDAGVISTGVLAAARIGAETITGDKLVIGTIDEDQLASGAVTATVIANGAVTTGKVAANAVTAGKIATNAVTAAKINAGAVTAIKIDSNAVTTAKLDADAITSKHTITGARIQTSATNNRGIKLTSASLSAYDSSGTRTVYVSAASGNATIIGTMQTGVSGNRVIMGPTANYDGQPGIRLYSGGSGARDAALFITPAGTGGGWDSYDTVLAGSETTRNSSGRADLVLKHGGDFKLTQTWGSRSNYGLHKDGNSVYLRGRNPGGRYSFYGGTMLSEFMITQNPISVGGSSYWTSTPRPSGTSAAVANPSSSAANSARPIVTVDTSASEVRVYLGRNNSTATAAWVQAGWVA